MALSRVKTLEGLQILNYKNTAFRKDKRVEQEMIRLQSRAITFDWPISSNITSRRMDEDMPFKCQRIPESYQ